MNGQQLFELKRLLQKFNESIVMDAGEEECIEEAIDIVSVEIAYKAMKT